MGFLKHYLSFDFIRGEADELYEELKVAEFPYHKVANGKVTIIWSDKEFVLLENNAKKVTQKACQRMCSSYAIPILVYLSNRYYTDSSIQGNLPWVGVALKTALALICRNNFCNETAKSTWIKDLIETILLAGILSQIEGYREIYSAFPKYLDYGDVNFYDEGFITTPKMNFISNKVSNYYGGNSFRTSKVSQRIIENVIDAVGATGKIMYGADPKSFSVFKDTLLSEIPASASDFWRCIDVRLLMYAKIVMQKESKQKDLYDLSIVPGKSLENIRGEAAIKNIVWNKKWYKARITGQRISNMLVERPVLNINGNFITSSYLIYSSFAWILEAAIMGYTPGVIPNSKQLSDKYIRHEFEKEITLLCEKYGFIAGEVTQNGAWKRKDKTIVLKNYKQDKCGQIDVLAFHPEKKVGLVIECKILDRPANYRSLRNVAEKLGIYDERERFHSKLRKKVTSIAKEVELFGINPFLFSAIVTDQVPIYIERDQLIINTVELEVILKNIRDMGSIGGCLAHYNKQGDDMREIDALIKRVLV